MLSDADNIRYTKRGEWVMLDDETVTIGLTDAAQSEIPDIEFVELPTPDEEMSAGEEAVAIESADESLSVAAPLEGRISEVNELLEADPGLINKDPYGDGWIFRMEVQDPTPWLDFMTAEEYEKYLER